MTNKLPEMNNDYFEKIIISNALTNKTYMASIADEMDAIYFKDKNIQIVYRIIIDFYKKRGILPNGPEIKTYLTTEEHRKAFETVLKELSSDGISSTEYDLDELISNTERFLKEKAIYRAILSAADEMSKSNVVDSSKMLSTFEKACSISLIENLGHEYLRDIDNHIDDLHKVQNFISTGYLWLDKMLGGGLLSTGRAMYVFSGVTNAGKSIILGNVAANVLSQNKKVVVISLEMPETMYSLRISGQLSKIPLGKLKEQTGSLRDFVEKYKKQHTDASLYIKEFPPKSVTVNHIKAYLDKLYLKRNFKPDVIVVDYVNLMLPTLVTGKLYEDIKLTAEQLRSISYTYKCPVITATQLNRAAFDETNPGLETTSESMGLSHTADFQAAVWSSDSDKELGILHMGIQKNRFGTNYGINAFKIDYETLSISEMDEDYVSSHQVGSVEKSLSSLGSLLGEQEK